LISQSTGAGKGTYEKRVGKRDAWVAQLVELLGLLAQRGACFSLCLPLPLVVLSLSPSLSDKQMNKIFKKKVKIKRRVGKMNKDMVVKGKT